MPRLSRRRRGRWRPPRFLWPRSLPARTTLAAALAAAVLFGAGAEWVREVVYHQRFGTAESDARRENNLIATSMTTTTFPTGSGWGDFPYEIVSSDGSHGASSDVQALEIGGRSLLPLPDGTGYSTRDVMFGPAPRGVPDPFADMTLGVIEYTELVSEVPQGSPDAALRLPANGSVAVYVIITPFAARAAVDAVDRVLYPGVPLAVLLVAAVAYLATRRALRPVEAIRARTAAVTAADPRERVQVPDSGDAIERLATTINATLQRLDDAARTQRQFVADAAHELRSPLTTLLATLEVAEIFPDGTDWYATVATAADQTRRVQTLAEDLLLLARFDAAVAAPVAPVDLADLAYEFVADYRKTSDAVEVTCRASDPVTVLGTRRHLERLLRNLLDNAVRHATHHVEVRVAADGDTVHDEAVLTVADDGPGIPADQREHIFERFARLDDARSRDTGGTGLGLAIVRDIATRHGGTVAAADSVSGALLVVRLPLADD